MYSRRWFQLRRDYGVIPFKLKVSNFYQNKKWEPEFVQSGLKSNYLLFIQIQSAFHKLTGLNLSLIADLQIQQLSDSADEIFSQLEKDVDAVAKIEKARKEFYKAHPQQYEKMAQFRDEINKQLSQLSHIQNVRFTVYGFYEIDFSIEENEIELYFFYGQEYALHNLIRVLIDLGGKFYDGDKEERDSYPETWKRYKKWQQYKWYNRPRK